MAAGYIHVEVSTAQSSKKPDQPCGDVVQCNRTESATTIVCADGIGSGIHAHIAAAFCATRFQELMRLGSSLRTTFASIVRSVERNREPKGIYAAISTARLLNDGMTTILAYDAPQAILLSHRQAAVIPTRSIELGGALVAESECYIGPGEAILLMSDGITQAGLGCGLAMGWQTEGVIRFINDHLTGGRTPQEIPRLIHDEARRLWRTGGDDCTAVMALCRRGVTVNVLTGPPSDAALDTAAVRRFNGLEGIKIVCGGTTAGVVARAIQTRVRVDSDTQSMLTPPRYAIDGIDLVTEGAVTLNQAYNVIDENIDNLAADSGVTEFCSFLQIADRINFLVGDAKNTASSDISFKQCGILTRERIVPLLAEKLMQMGKLVVVNHI